MYIVEAGIYRRARLVLHVISIFTASLGISILRHTKKARHRLKDAINRRAHRIASFQLIIRLIYNYLTSCHILSLWLIKIYLIFLSRNELRLGFIASYRRVQSYSLNLGNISLIFCMVTHFAFFYWDLR